MSLFETRRQFRTLTCNFYNKNKSFVNRYCRLYEYYIDCSIENQLHLHSIPEINNYIVKTKEFESLLEEKYDSFGKLTNLDEIKLMFLKTLSYSITLIPHLTSLLVKIHQYFESVNIGDLIVARSEFLLNKIKMNFRKFEYEIKMVELAAMNHEKLSNLIIKCSPFLFTIELGLNKLLIMSVVDRVGYKDYLLMCKEKHVQTSAENFEAHQKRRLATIKQSTAKIHQLCFKKSEYNSEISRIFSQLLSIHRTAIQVLRIIMNDYQITSDKKYLMHTNENLESNETLLKTIFERDLYSSQVVSRDSIISLNKIFLESLYKVQNCPSKQIYEGRPSNIASNIAMLENIIDELGEINFLLDPKNYKVSEILSNKSIITNIRICKDYYRKIISRMALVQQRLEKDIEIFVFDVEEESFRLFECQDCDDDVEFSVWEC